jgi:hypothetical protein
VAVAACRRGLEPLRNRKFLELSDDRFKQRECFAMIAALDERTGKKQGRVRAADALCACGDAHGRKSAGLDRIDEAEQAVRSGLQIATRAGYTFAAGFGSVVEGRLALEREKPDAARAAFLRALETFERSGATFEAARNVQSSATRKSERLTWPFRGQRARVQIVTTIAAPQLIWRLRFIRLSGHAVGSGRRAPGVLAGGDRARAVDRRDHSIRNAATGSIIIARRAGRLAAIAAMIVSTAAAITITLADTPVAPTTSPTTSCDAAIEARPPTRSPTNTGSRPPTRT